MNSSVKGSEKTRSKKPRVWQKALGFFILGKVLSADLSKARCLDRLDNHLLAAFQSRARFLADEVCWTSGNRDAVIRSG